MSQALLEVQDLRTYFQSEGGLARAVDGVGFSISRGETLAIVGESGSGKSVTSLSVMRLIPSPPGRIAGGRVMFYGKDGTSRDLLLLPEHDMRRVRGNDIGMIFQEPMSSLNPLLTVGEQIAEVLRLHHGLGRAAAREQAQDMLARVNIPDARKRAADYPHHLSGGMRQRVMIAMAVACQPALLIADEPTTALDVTIQAQILNLLRGLQAELGMGLLFITYNLGVVAQIADRVAVMYAGRVVEQGSTAEVFAPPLHPYTRALLQSIPRLGPLMGGQRLLSIAGQVPSPTALPPGCAFTAHCLRAAPACLEAPPPEEEALPGHTVRCLRWAQA